VSVRVSASRDSDGAILHSRGPAHTSRTGRLDRASRPAIEYRLLGSFEVVRNEGGVIQLRAKERAVLLCLLLRAGEIVPADQLIDDVWGARPPRCVANALHNCISRIRRGLEPPARAATPPPLVTYERGYLLGVQREQLDSGRVEALLEESRRARDRGRFDQAAGLLRLAASLWRGRALADFSFADFARSEIARLEELRLLVLSERIDVELRLGGQPQLVCELKRLVAEHPFHERFRAQLMLALYQSGRQADALAAYREAHETLVAELGIGPSRPLQLLERAILRQEPFIVPPLADAPV
jgi:DNA-binding SARP family transcriptional activator